MYNFIRTTLLSAIAFLFFGCASPPASKEVHDVTLYFLSFENQNVFLKIDGNVIINEELNGHSFSTEISLIKAVRIGGMTNFQLVTKDIDTQKEVNVEKMLDIRPEFKVVLVTPYAPYIVADTVALLD